MVETKVKAATAGAGLGVILSDLALYLADLRWGPLSAAVSAAVPLVVATGLTWAAGYRAHHTRRTDLPAFKQ